MACMTRNKVAILPGDTVTRKAQYMQSALIRASAPVDTSLTVSSEFGKISKFYFKATDGNIYKAYECTKP